VLFEERTARVPDAVAVVYEGAELTYRDLNERANRLAHYLRGLGAAPGARIGICVERSLEMVVGMLGILKVGDACFDLNSHANNQSLVLIGSYRQQLWT
jgi:non-ribosomal peptide synthetase component F